MPAREVFRASAPRFIQRDRLFLATIHGKAELEPADSVIVLGLDLHVHLLDRVGPHVTAWLAHRDRRRLIVQRLDQVIG